MSVAVLSVLTILCNALSTEFVYIRTISVIQPQGNPISRIFFETKLPKAKSYMKHARHNDTSESRMTHTNDRVDTKHFRKHCKKTPHKNLTYQNPAHAQLTHPCDKRSSGHKPRTRTGLRLEGLATHVAVLGRQEGLSPFLPRHVQFLKWRKEVISKQADRIYLFWSP